MKRKTLGIISLLCFLIAGFIAYQIGWAFPPIPPTNMASPGAIGGTTPAAGTFTTLNADHIGENTGSHGVVFDNNVDIGSTTAGKNETIYATLGNEMAPALEAANWTLGYNTGGWAAGSGVLSKTASTGTQTATPSGTFTVTAGVTYKVVMVVSAAANSPTYTLGGVAGTTLTATTITDYITASTTGKIIFSGGASATCTITSLTVKALTDATGDLTVEGNLLLRSPLLLSRAGYASGGYPNIALNSDPTTGINIRSGQLEVYSAGTAVSSLGATLNSYSDSFRLQWGANTDIKLLRDAANSLALNNGTSQQKFNVYNTSSGGDYERLSLTGVQGVSVDAWAETAGTGADNLDFVIHTAGTGQLKNTASAITSGSGTGVTVNHTGAIIQQVYKVTTTYAAYSDTDLTKGIVIATLPAKTRLIAAYADTTQAYAGTDITAATLEVGVTAEGAAEIIAVHDVKTGVVTKGLADADMGTGMTRAAQIQGAYTPSFTGTTAVYATIDATTGAATTLANLTAGSTTFYLITEKLP